MGWSSAFKGRVAADNLERSILVAIRALLTKCLRSTRRAAGAHMPPKGDMMLFGLTIRTSPEPEAPM